MAFVGEVCSRTGLFRVKQKLFSTHVWSEGEKVGFAGWKVRGESGVRWFLCEAIGTTVAAHFSALALSEVSNLGLLSGPRRRSDWGPGGTPALPLGCALSQGLQGSATWKFKHEKIFLFILFSEP